MKRNNLLFLIVLFLGLSLLSCNNDSSNNKDDDSDLLTGKWIPSKIGTIEENGKETLQDISNPGKCDSGLFEYIADGTFSSLGYEFQDNKCIPYIKKGTWSLKDKIVTANFTDGPITLEIIELNKSTLKLKQTIQFGTTPLALVAVYNRK